MKPAFLILFMAAIAAVASAQTGPKTPTTSPSTAKSSSSTPAPSTATPTKPGTAASSTLTPWIKLPLGVPRVAHGPVKMPFALRYEDIKIGAGPEGEPGKVWHIKYTGWRAADGVKFDSWEQHVQPVIGPDGKPQLGPDGKPKLGEPQPIAVRQGVGRVIPGFDYGLEGMRVGGKRRLFIPWQIAYGSHAIPDRPDHPGIPAKSDLIFDMELVEVTDTPMPPSRPATGAMPPHSGMGTAPVHLGAPPASAQPASTATPAAPAAKPATPAQPAAPAQTQPK